MALLIGSFLCIIVNSTQFIVQFRQTIWCAVLLGHRMPQTVDLKMMWRERYMHITPDKLLNIHNKRCRFSTDLRCVHAILQWSYSFHPPYAYFQRVALRFACPNFGAISC